MKISLSIIIPVYNEEKTITKILDRVSELKKNTNLEIIVVNDGSTDGTLNKLIEGEKLYNKLINLDKNLGKG